MDPVLPCVHNKGEFVRLQHCKVFYVMMMGCLVPSCREEMPNGPRVATVPVQGIVVVDGEPAAALAIKCIPEQPLPETVPPPSSFTDKDGHFTISTFESGDGAPPGKYKLTFNWGRYNLLNGRYGGPDKLNGKYDDLEESPVEFTVDDSKETIDLGRIELTTSPPKK